MISMQLAPECILYVYGTIRSHSLLSVCSRLPSCVMGNEHNCGQSGGKEPNLEHTGAGSNRLAALGSAIVKPCRAFPYAATDSTMSNEKFE